MGMINQNMLNISKILNANISNMNHPLNESIFDKMNYQNGLDIKTEKLSVVGFSQCGGRKKKAKNINKAKNVERKPKECKPIHDIGSNENKIIECESQAHKILQGSFSQLSSEFMSNETLGTQCTSMSVISVIYSSLKGPSNWSMYDMNDILFEDDKHHQEIIKKRKEHLQNSNQLHIIYNTTGLQIFKC